MQEQTGTIGDGDARCDDQRAGRQPGVRDGPTAAGRLQLDRAEGAGPRAARSVDLRQCVSAIEQARANVAKARADVERLRVSEADGAVKLARARSLAEKQLIPATALQNAEVTLQLAQAQVRSSDAQVTLARASLQEAEVNLSKTVITSPTVWQYTGRLRPRSP